MFTLKFSMAVESFDGSLWQRNQAIANVLHDVAERIAAGTISEGDCRDPNNSFNVIGSFKAQG